MKWNESVGHLVLSQFEMNVRSGPGKMSAASYVLVKIFPAVPFTGVASGGY
jgi:hypothetical protein